MTTDLFSTAATPKRDGTAPGLSEHAMTFVTHRFPRMDASGHRWQCEMPTRPMRHDLSSPNDMVSHDVGA